MKRFLKFDWAPFVPSNFSNHAEMPSVASLVLILHEERSFFDIPDVRL